MYRAHSTATRILALVLFFISVPHSAATAAPPSRIPPGSSSIVPPSAFPSSLASTAQAPQVTLSAAQTTTSWDSRLAERAPFALPLLTLHQQRQTADARERTLIVHVAGLAGGTPVELEARSWHEHPTTGRQHNARLRATLPEGPCTAATPCALRWTLDAAAMIGDYYRLTLRSGDGALLWQNPHPERPDFVALDRWDLDLQPYTVRITYGALFPFARGARHHDERLAPEAVHALVGEQIAPAIARTWRTQFEAWGFGPIHPQWDADGVVEVIFTCPPFALLDEDGTYTISTYADGTPYPERRVWIRADDEVLAHYDTLESGLKVVLSHEFFHLAQWNVRLSAGQAAPRWTNVIVEAQAIAAASIQYPEIELSRDHLSASRSQYSASADRYLERRLNTAYADLEAEPVHRYDAALYWRFLYERCGDLRVFRYALQEMVRQTCTPPSSQQHRTAERMSGEDAVLAQPELPDCTCAAQPASQQPSCAAGNLAPEQAPAGAGATETAAALDAIMDAALSRLAGPFETYEQSIAAFARANAALRLENGRCTSGDRAACGDGYDDPHRMYTIPPCEAHLAYRGAALAHAGAIPASFGADLIQVSLDAVPLDGSLAIAFRSAGARFGVQVWKLRMDAAGPRNPARGLTGLHALTPQPETLSAACSAACRLTVRDLEQVDRLLLIVVRLDADEQGNPQSAYQLSLG